jgi:bifunctional oligoribonuclease and PAP phosphatase NrnA
MKKEYRKLKSLISKSKSILILTHKGPDFDGFCSALILKKAIDTISPKKEVVFKTSQYPTLNIPYMHEIQMVQRFEITNEDLVIIVDAGSWDMCTVPSDSIRLTEAKIAVIDHHKTRPMENIEIEINTKLSSATEEVLTFLKESYGRKFKITKEISHLGQIGIVFDTGRFLFDNTKPETYELMAELRRIYPLDLDEFTYKSNKFPLETLKPLMIYIRNLRVQNDMAFTYLTNKDLNENNLTKKGVNNAQHFIRDNIIRYIHGIHWGFVVKPSYTEENAWKISFRSTKGYQEVDKIAETLDGGGHQYSAATKIVAQDGDQAAMKVIKAISNNITSS